jgi:hypothetical protein
VPRSSSRNSLTGGIFEASRGITSEVSVFRLSVSPQQRRERKRQERRDERDEGEGGRGEAREERGEVRA